MAAGDIYECVYDAVYGGQQVCSVFHFVQVGSDGAGDARDSVNLMFSEELKTPYLAGLMDTFVSLGTRTRRIKPTETQALTAGFSDTGTHDIGEGLPPNQVAVMRTYGPLLQAIPPLKGTRGIGRVLVCGLPEEDVNQGRINSDQIVFRNLLGAKLITDLGDGTSTFLWRAAVYSRVDNIARKIDKANILTQVKNLRSRTRSS